MGALDLGVLDPFQREALHRTQVLTQLQDVRNVVAG